MTYIFDTYNFMDLLKDKKYVPEADVTETTYTQDINEMIDTVSAFVKSRTEDYDFMDLLGDKGYQSVNDNWVKSHSNDNQSTLEVAS
ncbi:hypothetical protein [Pseudemcibacter aquimaris]|uniref:hypothetical protein n=1 Tax=Pseudemcibacter aquimaris TaxID=2857064 RepID=UPI0020137547|nr:hypothetical protein [Pseudemcibacter aquimaris]MCC3861355.1 hypothetical protein [Pseudemcibacter aquimaris]WDU58127.1 hypothetical protein KW060_13100 [Pseudemcibacter aquimaris]